jgi:hypothetical protein
MSGLFDFQSCCFSESELGFYQSPGDLITASGAKPVDRLELAFFL